VPARVGRQLPQCADHFGRHGGGRKGDVPGGDAGLAAAVLAACGRRSRTPGPRRPARSRDTARCRCAR
jgi:hypothetical protein